MTTTYPVLYRAAILSELLWEYRKTNPRSRAQSLHSFSAGLNTGRRKRRDCVLCGQAGESWCADYRRTIRSIDAEYRHENYHVAQQIIAWGGLGLYGDLS